VIPRIVVGTSSLGSVLPEPLASSRAREETFAYLDRLVAMGCKAFDLAASYQIGGTERLFGAWMESRKNRDELFLVGKGCHPLPVVEPHRLTARALEDDLHASLRRLRTDAFDLYLLHRDDASAALEPVVRALLRAREQGKIRAWGVSNFAHDRVRTITELAKSAGLGPPEASSPHFSLFDWTRPPFSGCVSIAGDAGRAARDFYTSSSLRVLAWQPLGAGFAAARPSRAYASAANRERLGRAERLARARGATVAQIALAYLFHQPFEVHAVVASRNVDNMRKNVEAEKLELSGDELRWLESGEGAPP
jgi:aryl-alcohol dehydrogenase-like predicted oxidoreductase